MHVFAEMWSRRQAASLLPLLITGWLTGETSEALSTFGKTNTHTSNQPAHPTPPPPRACSKQGDCITLSGTSCVRTQFDATTRCLCGDNYPPVNGKCDSSPKNLYHVCTKSDDCIDGLMCDKLNRTVLGPGPAPPHLQFIAENDKICLCDGEAGFKEKDYTCNDADILKTSMLAVFLVICIRKISIN